jgi:nucleoid-associated protein YgaU
MTSDAKIGLLLGLIFIFVIAFIINGLPSLRPQTTKAEATTNAMKGRDVNLGLADREQKAQETMNWAELLDTQTDEPDELAPVARSPEPSVPAGSSDDRIRSILPLPTAESLEKLTKGLGDIVKNLAEASGPAAREKTTEPAPSIEPARTRVTQTQAARPDKPAGAAAGNVARTYVVGDGESLASVAKKVYGPEEGNRIVNIQRIYEANRNILKSPHEVRVGQELVIPPLEKTPAAVLPKTMFEPVGTVGNTRAPAAEKAKPEKTTAAERWYVVQEGDSLWQIASTQLGSGVRYEEIVRLNPDVSKDGTFINVGMRLRLPSK